MSITLALSAMFLIGMTHFINGMISQHCPAVKIALCTHIGGSICGLILSISLSKWYNDAMIWGMLSGIGSALGALFLYRALSTSPFGIVVPLSAVSMVLISVLLSLFFNGENPNLAVWLGIAISLPAVWLISGGKSLRKRSPSLHKKPGLILALLAGLGFAVQLHFLGKISTEANFYGISISMASGAILLLPFCLNTKKTKKMFYTLSFTAGGISVAGLALYTISQVGQLAIVSIIIVSMYPLIPVTLGSIVRKEKLSGSSIIGIVLSIVTTALVTIGSY